MAGWFGLSIRAQVWLTKEGSPMRYSALARRFLAAAGSTALIGISSLWADEQVSSRPSVQHSQPAWDDSSTEEDDPLVIYPKRGQLRYAAHNYLQDPSQPTQPESAALDVPVTAPSVDENPLRGFGGFGDGGDDLTPERQQQVESAPAADVVESTPAIQSTDSGSLLADSGTTTGVALQRRPVASDARIRGYRGSQIYAQSNGGWWQPVRPDLDSMLSKIDSGIIDDIILIKGPYAAQYGPGFAFIDVITAPAPRYCGGLGWEGRTALQYNTNGQGWYGRQSVGVGATDWGFRIGAGFRTASDYESGNGTLVPSGYKLRDIDVAAGIDVAPDAYVDFRGLRLDGTDIEYAGQIFDIDSQVTDAYNLRWVVENQEWFDQWLVEGWYNRTRINGSSARKGVPFPDIGVGVGGQQITFATTDIDQMSTGARSAVTWGDAQGPNLSVGTDLRYSELRLNEIDTTAGGSFNFPVPDSHQSNPGLYAEMNLPTDLPISFKTGGRLDWVSSNAASFVGSPQQGVAPRNFANRQNSQNYDLVGGFVTAEYEVNCEWSVVTGIGYAERAPNLYELYAFDPFVATLQSGASFLRGNQALKEERLLQTDVGLVAEYTDFRGGVHGFYAWADDYINYTGASGGFISFVNTPEATLAGGEVYGEADVTDMLTLFGNMSYVEGRDQIRNEPLPSIYPLQSYMGVRLHEASQFQWWGVEYAVRVVDNQDRIATSLREQPTAGFTVHDIRCYIQATERLTLTAGCLNVGDRQYLEHFDLRTVNLVPAFQRGRNYYIGAEWRY
jgi:outer membrane receptor protein involved in Fe transport